MIERMNESHTDMHEELQLITLIGGIVAWHGQQTLAEALRLHALSTGPVECIAQIGWFVDMLLHVISQGHIAQLQHKHSRFGSRSRQGGGARLS